MKIWWCQEHESSGDDKYCHLVDRFTTGCRMVPMRLIPDNALVTIITALDSDHSWYRCTGKHDLPLAAVLILAALDGETP